MLGSINAVYQRVCGCFCKRDDCEAGHPLGKFLFQDAYHGGAQALRTEGPYGFSVHMTDRLRPGRVSVGPDKETGVVNKDRNIPSAFIFHAVIGCFRMNSLPSVREKINSVFLSARKTD